jgi:hypothetical protein
VARLATSFWTTKLVIKTLPSAVSGFGVGPGYDASLSGTRLLIFSQFSGVGREQAERSSGNAVVSPQTACLKWTPSREVVTAKLTIVHAAAATQLNGSNDSSTPG